MLNFMSKTGIEIPAVGLGTYKNNSGEGLKNVVKGAYEAGYRLFDTAAFYGNEEALGEAIRNAGIPRQNVFVTTKVWNDAQRKGEVRESCEESLRRLGMKYIDLYLLHWPVREKTEESWKALESLLKEGKVRAIGVSNFLENDIKRLLENADRQPSLNQIERHPRLNQNSLVEFCHSCGIVVQAHSTLMRQKLSDNELLLSIARNHEKSVSQIILRWHLQSGVAVIPKTSNIDRIRENIDILDFELSEADMAAIDSLNNGERICDDPLNFDF